ncbi:response regulator receiver domain-containing protein [Rhodobacter sp. JA431]|uniref:hybrid sensor histidine kinase/response regulator n=1 Tax=Rhodobacter sp. JA431 TaxID=570013 RepID=UPI000BC786A5|nr:ATP-binding protein [Rhodobacter sp. JA431]SOB92679.1 response regulator receiver domain-containing protein [Rhodobacter sp. JA431]
MLLGHDLRTAVSDILGGLRLLAHEDMSHSMRLQLERMRAAGEDMARLLEEGIEIVTDQTIGPLRQTVQLARVIYDIEMRWSGRALEKGLGFHVAIAPNVPMEVQLDRIALERVLSNLLSNAVKYTYCGTVRLLVALEAERLQFSVSDDGPGFSDDVMARLFEPGARGDVSQAGSGLGLYISRDMAERLDGRIEIANRPEGGALVALSLPVEPLLPADAQIEIPLPVLNGMRVLVAEDSALSQAVAGHMLSTMGAHCDYAADGVEALQKLETDSYDLAVIDVEMPRLSGLDLMQALRSGRGPHAAMPIVACTAYVLRANRDAVLAAGADAIISKPLTTLAPLAEAITLALERARQDKTCPPILPPAPLDETTFETLLLINGPEGSLDLLDRLLDDLLRAERGLVSGLYERNTETIRADTHVLVSVAGSIGAEALRTLAEDLSQAAQNKDETAMQLIGRAVLAQTDRVIVHASRRLTRLEEKLK